MKRLLCIANSAAATFEWRNWMGLEPQHVLHHSPHGNPNRIRGLSEHELAIVWVAGNSDLTLGADHIRVLEIYVSLGVPQFSGYERDIIEMWMFGPGWIERRAQREAAKQRSD